MKEILTIFGTWEKVQLEQKKPEKIKPDQLSFDLAIEVKIKTRAGKTGTQTTLI